jgi:mono/diheme cytochrome c family protein
VISHLPGAITTRRIELWGSRTKAAAGAALVGLFLAPVHTLLAQDSSAVDAGKRQFEEKCAVCHGASATGDGVLADSLKQKPADLTRISERNGGTFPSSEVVAKIWGRDREIIATHIISEMPAFYAAPIFGKDEDFEDSAGRLSLQQNRNIVSYLATIQQP